MRIPLRYSIRNVARRKVRTALTILAVALVAGISTVMFGFSSGILRAARSSGSPDNIIVVDRNASSQAFSKISQRDFNLLQSLPQVARGQDGDPLISPEVVHQVRVDAGDWQNRPGTVRGVTHRIFAVNTLLRITDGERPAAGRKLMVGSLAHTALGVPQDSLALGKQIRFAEEDWTVAGRFSAGGTALDSEILADLADMMAVFTRDSYSSALLKLQRTGEVGALVHALNNRNDIQVRAVAETEYYRALQEGYDRVIFLAVLLAVLAAVGGLVSGMNTMYASVLGRIREIATLKVLGYRPADIVQSYLMESLAISTLGGLLGCMAATMADGVSAKFSSGAFTIQVDPLAMAAGAAVSLAIGVLGALPPALKGARMNIPAALHYA